MNIGNLFGIGILGYVLAFGVNATENATENDIENYECNKNGRIF